jgi:hypothetical protein
MDFGVLFTKSALVKMAKRDTGLSIKKLSGMSKAQLSKLLKTTLKTTTKLSCDATVFPKVAANDASKREGGWLSNVDIQNVMNIYQKSVKPFIFLGALSMDFQDTSQMFRRFNLDDLPETQIGIIFNTAKSTEKGEHWLSVFISKIDNTICIFDSNGTKPQKQLVDFITRINKDNKYTVFVNKRQKQYKDGTCGVFALNFIIERISGASCNIIFTDKHNNDSKMECIRSKMFY